MKKPTRSPAGNSLEDSLEPVSTESLLALAEEFDNEREGERIIHWFWGLSLLFILGLWVYEGSLGGAIVLALVWAIPFCLVLCMPLFVSLVRGKMEIAALLKAAQAEVQTAEESYELLRGRIKKQNTCADLEDWLSGHEDGVLKVLFWFCSSVVFVVGWICLNLFAAVLLSVLCSVASITAVFVLMRVGKLVCWTGARRWYEDIPPDGSADLKRAG
jgi:hypothetical protein